MKLRSDYFEKINKLTSDQLDIPRKIEVSKNKIKNERGDITTDNTQIQRCSSIN